VKRHLHIHVHDSAGTEVSFRKQTNGVWRLTFNGSIAGDGRAYHSVEEARRAAMQLVDREHDDARKHGYEPEYYYRPGY
jgi:hypothetical protein